MRKLIREYWSTACFTMFVVLYAFSMYQNNKVADKLFETLNIVQEESDRQVEYINKLIELRDE